MALASPLLRLAAGAQASRRARTPGLGRHLQSAGLHRRIPGVPSNHPPAWGCGCAFRGPQMRRGPLTHRTTTRHAMRALRYAPGATIAAASMALGLLVVMSLPDVRRNLKIRKA